MKSSCLFALAALAIVACDGGSPPADAATEASDAPVDAPVTVLVRGFVFDGPSTPQASPSGASFAIDLATGPGPSGVMLGAPCTDGDDCAALGDHAGCWTNGTVGFCTIDCDTDPEGPSELCPANTYCFAGMRTDIGRLCLPTCTTDSDCGAGLACSASLFTFNVASGTAPACIPTCASDSDCNTDVSGLVCHVSTHRCESPREVLASRCTTNDDCRGLGAGGACMRSTRDATASYCTRACDPTAGSCALGGSSGDPLGPCVDGYATTSAGANVAVCLRACGAEATCRARSNNTCNYVPSLQTSVCTVACTSNADCIDGACDASSGDCRASGFYATDCASDSNCPLGLCVSDFHAPGMRNCSARCSADNECPSGAVCVTSPVATDGAGEHLLPDTVTGPGFCAPACASGRCDDLTTGCLPSVNPPEIDFAGSGSAWSSFCWR